MSLEVSIWKSMMMILIFNCYDAAIILFRHSSRLLPEKLQKIPCHFKRSEKSKKKPDIMMLSGF